MIFGLVFVVEFESSIPFSFVGLSCFAAAFSPRASSRTTVSTHDVLLLYDRFRNSLLSVASFRYRLRYGFPMRTNRLALVTLRHGLLELQTDEIKGMSIPTCMSSRDVPGTPFPFPFPFPQKITRQTVPTMQRRITNSHESKPRKSPRTVLLRKPELGR